MTEQTLIEAILSVLAEASPDYLTAGSVHRVIERHYANTPSRDTVKRRLDSLAFSGDKVIAATHKVEVNGYIKPATVYQAKTDFYTVKVERERR